MNDADDARISRLIATQSELPVYSRTMTAVHEAPGSIFGGSSSTPDSPSLPAITRTGTYSSSCSISSSIGNRVLPMRVLEQHPQQPLSVPPPPGPSIYECPFNYLHCLCTFSNFEDWYVHSLTHFASVGPPTSTECCFCDEKFQNAIGGVCWRYRMEHVELHHQWGHRLSHARPAFGMIRYLWENKIIDNWLFKELSGNSTSRTQKLLDDPRSGGSAASAALRQESSDDRNENRSKLTVSIEGRRRGISRGREELTSARRMPGLGLLVS